MGDKMKKLGVELGADSDLKRDTKMALAYALAGEGVDTANPTNVIFHLLQLFEDPETSAKVRDLFQRMYEVYHRMLADTRRDEDETRRNISKFRSACERAGIELQEPQPEETPPPPVVAAPVASTPATMQSREPAASQVVNDAEEIRLCALGEKVARRLKQCRQVSIAGPNVPSARDPRNRMILFYLKGSDMACFLEIRPHEEQIAIWSGGTVRIPIELHTEISQQFGLKTGPQLRSGNEFVWDGVTLEMLENVVESSSDPASPL